MHQNAVACGELTVDRLAVVVFQLDPDPTTVQQFLEGCGLISLGTVRKIIATYLALLPRVQLVL